MKRNIIVLILVLTAAFITCQVTTSDAGEIAEVPPEIVVTEIAEPILLAEERDLIERVVYAESRGAPTIEAEMAVAQVIKDRSSLWDMTITEVLTAPRQFAKPAKGDMPERTKEAVSRVFDGGERAFDSNVTHFHSGRAPYWTKSKEYVGSRGGNHFYDSRY